MPFVFIELHSFAINSFADLKAKLCELDVLSVPHVGITGGGRFLYKNELLDLFPHAKLYDEMTCISHGFLANAPTDITTHDNSVIIANVGTGASFIKVNKNDKSFERIGGTNLGASVIKGLGNWKGIDFNADYELGQHSHVDTLVSDIYGCDYDRGGLLGKLVAGSLGKLSSRSTNADAFAGFLFMIASNLAHLLLLYSTIHCVREVVLSGGLSSIPAFKEAFFEAMQYYNAKGQLSLYFHPQAAYIGCLGVIYELNNS